MCVHLLSIVVSEEAESLRVLLFSQFPHWWLATIPGSTKLVIGLSL